MAASVRITLNGAERAFEDLEDPPHISSLIAALGFRADRIALERNGVIVPRAEWTSTPLADGDRIELVQFVGGG